MPKAWRILLPLGVLLTACSTPAEDSFSDSKIGYVSDPAAASADWDDAETVTVVLEDFTFSPEHLSFEAGKAYRFEIENRGESTHFFAAETFFKSVVTEKLIENGTAIERPLLRAVAVAPGESKELLLVPVRKGAYELHCTAPFHEALGMTGSIEII